MRDNGYGRIVNTCSAAGLLGAERMSNYGPANPGDEMAELYAAIMADPAG